MLWVSLSKPLWLYSIFHFHFCSVHIYLISFETLVWLSGSIFFSLYIFWDSPIVLLLLTSSSISLQSENKLSIVRTILNFLKLFYNPSDGLSWWMPHDCMTNVHSAVFLYMSITSCWLCCWFFCVFWWCVQWFYQLLKRRCWKFLPLIVVLYVSLNPLSFISKLFCLMCIHIRSLGLTDRLFSLIIIQ